jgi:hypothetical protein
LLEGFRGKFVVDLKWESFELEFLVDAVVYLALDLTEIANFNASPIDFRTCFFFDLVSFFLFII